MIKLRKKEKARLADARLMLTMGSCHLASQWGPGRGLRTYGWTIIYIIISLDTDLCQLNSHCQRDASHMSTLGPPSIALVMNEICVKGETSELKRASECKLCEGKE